MRAAAAADCWLPAAAAVRLGAPGPVSIHHHAPRVPAITAIKFAIESPMPIQNRMIRGALCAALLLPPLVYADALLRPLPAPDLSKVAPAQAKRLGADRAEFDKLRATLVGPPLAQAYADIGAEYAQAGFTDIAALALYDASQADPQDARWFYLRGVLAREQKQNAAARANFEAALALDRIYLPIRYRLSDTLVDLGDLDGAHKLLEGLVREHADQAVAFSMLGQLDLRLKRYADAVANLNHALKLEPKANQLYQPLAAAYTGLGNTQAAQDAAAKAGPVAPELADPLALGLLGGSGAKLSGTPLQQVRQLMTQGRIAAARSRLSTVLHDHPDDVDALALQARLEASVGDSLIAEAAANQALKLAPDNAIALLARGMVYEYAGNEAQAVAYYERAARADAGLALAQQLLGNADLRGGRADSAVGHFRRLVALLPADSAALAQLVAAEVAAGQCRTALTEVSAAQEKNPKNGDMMQIFVRLASTCAAAKPAERDMALDYAQTLYKQRPDAGDSSALALALAAHGRFKDAQQYQAEAIFEATRNRDAAAAQLYKAAQADFVAGKAPDRPWPAAHAYFKPPRLTPGAPRAASKKPPQ